MQSFLVKCILSSLYITLIVKSLKCHIAIFCLSFFRQVLFQASLAIHVIAESYV